MKNRYYTVVSPIRVFVHAGHSASNSYVGSSRVITTVMKAQNARKGDEIHALVGGTFLVRKGTAYEIDLKPAKPVFEKSYGFSQPWQIMEAYAKAGRAVEQDAPKLTADYRAARDKAGKKLPELHEQVIERTKSPEYDHLAGAVGKALAKAETHGVEYRWSMRDINAYGGASSSIKADGFGLEFYVFEDFRIRAKIPVSHYNGDPQATEGVLGENYLLWISPEEAEDRIAALVSDAFDAERSPAPAP